MERLALAPQKWMGLSLTVLVYKSGARSPGETSAGYICAFRRRNGKSTGRIIAHSLRPVIWRFETA